jgi:signal transduction histidine kinase
MATTTTAPRNWTYLTAKTITRGIAILAVTISYTHIVHLFNLLGLTGWQAYAAPIFIDGFAMLGLLARSESFAPQTRRMGLRFQIAATLVSLAANIGAGNSAGARIFGAMVVAGYVAAEMLAEKMNPAATKAEAVKATRSQAATKAAANKAEADRKAAERKERARMTRLAKQAERDSIEAQFAAPSAPVSPAPIGR